MTKRITKLLLIGFLFVGLLFSSSFKIQAADLNVSTSDGVTGIKGIKEVDYHMTALEEASQNKKVSSDSYVHNTINSFLSDFIVKFAGDKDIDQTGKLHKFNIWFNSYFWKLHCIHVPKTSC
jgi:hypothetical protein